uniref:Uncharacterized protein n=1 Tax=Anguilla anguilla TaxID=7936 RepID=A0A0E9TLC5_ANGAN
MWRSQKNSSVKTRIRSKKYRVPMSSTEAFCLFK